MNMSESAGMSPSPRPLSVVPVEDQTERSIRARESIRLPLYLQDVTSLDAGHFVQYMNEIGWPQDATFMALLSNFGYHFDEEDGRVITRRYYPEVAPVLSLLISELLPFHFPPTNLLPRLPTEIWECIIDRISYKNQDHVETETLHACALVCRSWHIRARLHLYREFWILSDHIPKLQTTIRTNSSLSLSSTEVIRVKCGTKPVSALFLQPTLQNLKVLELVSLDLTKEHLLIMRGPLARSVTDLRLTSLHSCTVSNLLRFLNSFHSLAYLDVRLFEPYLLSHNGQILPRPRPIASRSLKTLSLWVVPGVGKLVGWYIREGYFLASLKKLRMLWGYRSSKDDVHFEVPASLLRQCMDALEDLSFDMYFDVNKGPFLNEFSNNVALSSLSNLRRIEWHCRSSRIFQIAATQFCSIHTPCKLLEIILDFYHEESEEIKDHCKAIDKALSSDNFPSLRSVQLDDEIPFDYFPTLQSRKLLRVYVF